MPAKVTIIEPDITKEENERNLKRVEEILTKIAKQHFAKMSRLKREQQ